MQMHDTVAVTVRIRKPIAERLENLARTLRRSRSSVAGEAIELLLEAAEEENEHRPSS
ncbi:hypothetical protein X744_22430 [Mesorhizobium sp. LNJC372A00]|nr:hypothetical protein X745_20940 [Mesorhizobium sp. LNJC374B00]ESY55987.1 hypothetical protein X744_22430 [Mesorhizobium sp. LNJC372A00]